jgi:hypothetical protein
LNRPLRKILSFGISLSLIVLLVTPAWGQTDLATDPNKTPQWNDLQKRVEILEQAELQRQVSGSEESQEITQLKLAMELPEPLPDDFTGLSPLASRIYTSTAPTVWGAIGEVHFTSEETGPRKTNFALLELLLGHRLSQNLIFNSAFSFQNGGFGETQPTSKSTSDSLPGDTEPTVTLSYAFMDFLFSENSGIRVGNILVPVGVTNLRFEPTFYPMVHRPRPERTIIPTPWHENGFLIFGKSGTTTVQLGLVNSGDISKAQSQTWIRAGRQEGSNALAEDLAWVARAEHSDKMSSLGTSLYQGKWSQRSLSADQDLGASSVILAEIHGHASWGRLVLQAQHIEGFLSDTEKIFAATGAALGKHVRGGSLIVSFDLLPASIHLLEKTQKEPRRPFNKALYEGRLPIFVSWEHDDLRYELSPGVTDPGGLSTHVFTIGLNYNPHPQVALKTDFAYEESDAKQIERVVETAIAFTF